MVTGDLSPKRTLLFVLGMHRSGTSALTRSLSFLGFSLPTTTMAPNQNNRSGFWESQEIATLNEAILNDLNSSWYKDTYDPLGMVERDKFQRWVSKAAELLDSQYVRLELAAVKEPRLCRVAPVWIDAAKALGSDPTFLLVYRNPYEVALSLKARNEFDLAYAIDLWTSYTLDAERNSRGFPRACISYEQLLSSNGTMLNSALKDIGLTGYKWDQKSAQRVAAFLSPREYRQRAKDEHDRHLRDLNPIAYELYRLLSANELNKNANLVDDVRRRWEETRSRRYRRTHVSGKPRMAFEAVDTANGIAGMGDIETSITLLRANERIFPDSFQIPYRRAQLHMNLQQWSNAELAVRRAIGLENGRPDHHALLGEALRRQNRFKEAVKAMYEAIRLDGSWAPYRHQVGMILLMDGQYSEALLELNQAIELDSQNKSYAATMQGALEKWHNSQARTGSTT